MIDVLGKIHDLPGPLHIAVSGGVDSMACLDFIRNGRHNVNVVHFNHGTEHGKEAEQFVRGYCAGSGLQVTVGKITSKKPAGKSQEEHWRDERYKFFNTIPGTLLTCHHLNDQVENWIFTSLNGLARLIPYKRDNVVRPFLLTPKAELIRWCTSKHVPWIEDGSNQEVKHVRNRIRHRIMPEVLEINPGIEKVIARKVREMYEEHLDDVEEIKRNESWEDYRDTMLRASKCQ